MTYRFLSLWLCLLFAGAGRAYAAPADNQAQGKPDKPVSRAANAVVNTGKKVGNEVEERLPIIQIGRVVHGKSAGYPKLEAKVWEDGYRGDTVLAPYNWKYAPPDRRWFVLLMIYILYAICGVILLYAARHYWFTFNRLFGKQRHPYIDIDEGDWPNVTVAICAHNEEAVIEGIISALLDVDYPHHKLRIMPVNDRSEDRTKEIIDEWTAKFPGRLDPFHRTDGKAGKGAALIDATKLVKDDILLVFDADYIPGRGLIKQLVSPFFDPEVGAVMGRVVPSNVGHNLLTRLLDLERTGGYQVDQQARMNMHLVPAYAGTVGGVRVSALRSVGGWNENALTEDTDITYRLLMNNWQTVYQNRSECYEEVPQEWSVRIRQIMRWARGHNDCMRRYFGKLVTAKHLSWKERFDGLMLLGVYIMSPLILIGCLLALTIFYLGANPLFGVIAIFAVAAYGTMGNFAVFFEIAAAARLDGSRHRIRLLPLNMLAFLVSTISISRSSAGLFSSRKGLVWDKTKRYRGDKPA